MGVTARSLEGGGVPRGNVDLGVTWDVVGRGRKVLMEI